MRGGLHVVEEAVGRAQQHARGSHVLLRGVDLILPVGRDLVGHRRVLLE